MLMDGFDVAHVMQHNMWWLVGCVVAFGQGQAPHVEHRPHLWIPDCHTWGPKERVNASGPSPFSKQTALNGRRLDEMHSQLQR